MQTQAFDGLRDAWEEALDASSMAFARLVKAGGFLQSPAGHVRPLHRKQMLCVRQYCRWLSSIFMIHFFPSTHFTAALAQSTLPSGLPTALKSCGS